MKKLLLLFVMAALAALLVACAAPGAAPVPASTAAPSLSPTPAPTPTPEPAPTPFSMLWMSDTQNYLSGYPEVLNAMTGWVAKEHEACNAVCLLHSGDILAGSFDETQRERLATAFALLPSDLPIITAGGNHDRGYPPKYYQYFYDYRPDTAIDPNNAIANGECYYTTFTAGGVRFLVLSVSYKNEKSCVDWANQVLADHPDHYAILLTHSYLDPLLDKYNDGYTSSGDTLRDKVVLSSPNVRLVLSGHMRGAVHRELTPDDTGDGLPDRTVYQLMFNAQEDENGGNGYLRILTFDPVKDTLTVVTYSPFLDAYGMEGDDLGSSHTFSPAGLSDFMRS